MFPFYMYAFLLNIDVLMPQGIIREIESFFSVFTVFPEEYLQKVVLCIWLK